MGATNKIILNFDGVDVNGEILQKRGHNYKVRLETDILVSVQFDSSYHEINTFPTGEWCLGYAVEYPLVTNPIQDVQIRIDNRERTD